MFDGLKRKAAVSVIGAALNSLAKSADTRTTLAGLLAAAAIGIPGFNLTELAAGDISQIAHLGAALTVALLGYWATKLNRGAATSAAGCIAGALYSCSGQVSDIIIAVLLALGGYLTNQPMKATEKKT